MNTSLVVAVPTWLALVGCFVSFCVGIVAAIWFLRVAFAVTVDEELERRGSRR